MKDEIKEIIELIQETIDEGQDEFGDFKKLLDYIKNLQKEIKRLKLDKEFAMKNLALLDKDTDMVNHYIIQKVLNELQGSDK